MTKIITEPGAYECKDGSRAVIEYVGRCHAMGYAGPESYHGSHSCMCWNVDNSVQINREKDFDIIGKWDKKCKTCNRILDDWTDYLSEGRDGECWGCIKDRR